MSWQFLGVLGVVLIVAAFLEGGISVTGVANISRAKGAVGAVVLVVAGVAVLGMGYLTWREKPPEGEERPSSVERFLDGLMSGIDDLVTTSRPDLEVSPQSGPLGGTITLTGTGFDAGERVDIRIGNTIVATPRANDEGAFSVAVRISRGTFCPSNQCPIVAQGKDSVRWIDSYYNVTG